MCGRYRSEFGNGSLELFETSVDVRDLRGNLHGVEGGIGSVVGVVVVVGGIFVQGSASWYAKDTKVLVVVLDFYVSFFPVYERFKAN